MQLLKITTTPIKYRIESERASIELAEPDSTKSFQQVQKTVIQQHGKTQLSSGQDLDSNSDVISADSSGKIRTDSMIKSSSEKMGSDDYLIKYRYGQNKKPQQSYFDIQNDIPVHKNISIQEKLDQIKSLKPDLSWEPSHSDNDTSFKTCNYTEINQKPEYEFTPATWRLIVKEMADVKIEYLGGFNYVPKRPTPDCKETGNSTD